MRTCATLFAFAAMTLAFGDLAQAQNAAPPPPQLVLSSTAYANGAVIPDKYTAASPSPVSPPLSWINTPSDTQSFALIMHDPDGVVRKSSSDALHWLVFNIPGTATSLPEGVPGTPTLPDGTIQAPSQSGRPGFMGPGSRGYYHNYTIELYALDSKLSLGPDATRPQVLAAMEGHVVGKSTLVGRFKR